MKRIIPLFYLLIPVAALNQNPQFAVVRPDGTTYICPTFDSAYNRSANGDYIYLPGGNFTLTNPISKSLHICGAGYNTDSSFSTGITTLNGGLIILQGGDNGSVEGLLINSPNIQVTPSITFGNSLSAVPFANYTIKRCSLTGGIGFQMPSSSITIINNLIGGIGNAFSNFSISGDISNSLISNNIIKGNYLLSSSPVPNLEVDNNIFFYYQNTGFTISFAYYSVYKNNIFEPGGPQLSSVNSYFYNNTNGYVYGPGNISYNHLTEAFNVIFADPGTVNGWGFYDYDVHNDYHIKTTSACHNSGSDGTDRGIYGGTFPWIEGSVPSNPHIYFKQVSGQTNTSGQLPVQFKVRTNN